MKPTGQSRLLTTLDRGGMKPSLFLLGSPRVEYGGQPVTIDRHKAMALLAYLALAGSAGGQRRDALAALFWPDLDQTHARSDLRRALATLTKALPGDWWDIDRETISLQRGPGLWLDVDEFHRLLALCRAHGHSEAGVCSNCVMPLSEAAALYRGDLLAGFTLPGSPDFDDWQLSETENLRREFVGALERLVRAHSAERNYDLAIRYARRLLALDPLHEPAHCSLMRLYVWANQRHMALRQYAECARVLEQELGVPPEAATIQLYEAIKANQKLPGPEPLDRRHDAQAAPAQQAQLITRPQPAPVQPLGEYLALPLEWMVRGQLVGRERELARANEIWQHVVASEAYTLLVSGEPGIGKTRLVREFTRLAKTSGARVLAAECYAEGSAPYAPIAEIIRESLSSLRGDLAAGLPAYVLADLITLAPDLRLRYPEIPANPPLDPRLEQQRLYDSVLALFETLAEATQAPSLVLLEDVHWADRGTLSLLRYLARRARVKKLRLFMIATYRDTEVDLEEAHTLKEILLDLNRERLADHVRLGRLDRDQTRQLLATILATGAEISAEFLDGIYGETEGNPFFVEEVCKALIEEGKLYRSGGYWRRADMASTSIPSSVRVAIVSRVQRLPPVAQETLRLAAIIGREFDFETLKGTSDVDEEALVEALERAEQAQLVSGVGLAGQLSFTFAHALIPFALRESLSALRRQRLHRRVAEALESQRRNNFEVQAYHWAAAGEYSKAVECSRQAAHRARAMYAYEVAVQQLSNALDWVEVVGNTGTRLTVLEELADIHRLLDEGTRAIPLYQEALAVWRSLQDADKWVAVRLYRKIGEAVTSMNRFAEFQRLAMLSRSSLETGLILTEGEPPCPETVRLLKTLSKDAWYTAVSIDWDKAERYARAAVEMAEQLDAPVELSASLEALAAVYGARGLLRERLQVCLRRLALSRGPRFTDQRERASIVGQVGHALFDVGEYADALPHLLEAEELATQIQDPPKQADMWTLLGECYLRLDRWDEVAGIEDQLRILQTRYPFERLGVLVCIYLACNASVRALRGDLERANTLRQEAYDFMVTVAGGPPDVWTRNQHF